MREIMWTLAIFVTAALVTTSLPISASAAEEYYGRWMVTPDDDGEGTLEMVLENGANEEGLVLSKTDQYCEEPGVSYEEVNHVLENNGDEDDPIRWEIKNECVDTSGWTYVRICVYNAYGEEACSTYMALGWDDFPKTEATSTSN